MKPWRWNNFHFAFMGADLSETVPFSFLFTEGGSEHQQVGRFKTAKCKAGKDWCLGSVQGATWSLDALNCLSWSKEVSYMLVQLPDSQSPDSSVGTPLGCVDSVKPTPGLVLLHVLFQSTLLSTVISIILHARKQRKDPRSRDPLFLHLSPDFCSILLPVDFPSLATLAICLSSRLVTAATLP